MSNNKDVHIPLGSGYLYAVEFSGTIPEDSAIETEDNRAGYIEGGGELDYKPTSKTVKDDYGIVSRTVITAEEASLVASLIAWSSAKFALFNTTARIDEKTKTGHRIIKLGGLNNDSGKVYLWRFVHPDKQFGDVRITLVGSNTGEMKLAFKQDDAGKMDIEVSAQSADDDGTLIIYDEDISYLSAT